MDLYKREKLDINIDVIEDYFFKVVYDIFY